MSSISIARLSITFSSELHINGAVKNNFGHLYGRKTMFKLQLLSKSISPLQNTYTHTHTIVLRLLWILSGTTRLSQYQKGKTSLDLLEQQIVSGSCICSAICNAYSLQPPARSHPAGDTSSPHPHSTHPQSSSLHGAVKAGSRSKIEKRLYLLPASRA